MFTVSKQERVGLSASYSKQACFQLPSPWWQHNQVFTQQMLWSTDTYRGDFEPATPWLAVTCFNHGASLIDRETQAMLIVSRHYQLMCCRSTFDLAADLWCSLSGEGTGSRCSRGERLLSRWRETCRCSGSESCVRSVWKTGRLSVWDSQFDFIQIKKKKRLGVTERDRETERERNREWESEENKGRERAERERERERKNNR